MKRALCLTLASSILGCGAEQVVLDETAGRVQLCAFGAADPETRYPLGPSGPQSFAAGAPILLHVAGASCVSSSCTAEVVASCRATVEGQTVRVEADFSWTETSGACTDDCRSIVATCATPALSAGLYTLVLGTRSATLTVGDPGPQTACIVPAG